MVANYSAVVSQPYTACWCLRVWVMSSLDEYISRPYVCQVSMCDTFNTGSRTVHWVCIALLPPMEYVNVPKLTFLKSIGKSHIGKYTFMMYFYLVTYWKYWVWRKHFRTRDCFSFMLPEVPWLATKPWSSDTHETGFTCIFYTPIWLPVKCKHCATWQQAQLWQTELLQIVCRTVPFPGDYAALWL